MTSSRVANAGAANAGLKRNANRDGPARFRCGALGCGALGCEALELAGRGIEERRGHAQILGAFRAVEKMLLELIALRRRELVQEMFLDRPCCVAS